MHLLSLIQCNVLAQFLFQLQQNHIFAKVNVGQRMRKISEPSDTWWGRSWMQSRNAMFGQEMLLY